MNAATSSVSNGQYHLIFADRIYKSHQSSVTNQRFSHCGQPHARVEVEPIIAIEGQLQEKASVMMFCKTQRQKS
jgi:hypothetical protein